MIIETIWDVGNVIVGGASLAANVWAGNYGDAAIDAGGLLVDLAAVALPFVPGGAGIKAARAAAKADKLLDVTKYGDKAVDATKTTVKILKEIGEKGAKESSEKGAKEATEAFAKEDTEKLARESAEKGGEAQKAIDMLDDLDADVKLKANPKTATQEGNITIQFDDTTKINLRVETHPLKKNGPPVRHGNVETITKKANKTTKRNVHITDED